MTCRMANTAPTNSHATTPMATMAATTATNCVTSRWPGGRPWGAPCTGPPCTGSGTDPRPGAGAAGRDPARGGRAAGAGCIPRVRQIRHSPGGNPWGQVGLTRGW